MKITQWPVGLAATFIIAVNVAAFAFAFINGDAPWHGVPEFKSKTLDWEDIEAVAKKSGWIVVRGNSLEGPENPAAQTAEIDPKSDWEFNRLIREWAKTNSDVVVLVE